MPVFDNRHCGAGAEDHQRAALPLPLPPSADELVPQELLNRIVQFAFAGHARLRHPAPSVPAPGPVQLRRRDHAVPVVNGE